MIPALPASLDAILALALELIAKILQHPGKATPEECMRAIGEVWREVNAVMQGYSSPLSASVELERLRAGLEANDAQADAALAAKFAHNPGDDPKDQ